jgi:uncharacterized phiE125 gp8 family phage protein
MTAFNMRRIVAPDVEPVTVDEVKLHTHISHSVEDALILGWIRTGRELAENYQRRSYYYQEWEMIFDSFPALPLSIPRPPLLSIDSLKYYGADNTEYTYDLSSLIIDVDSQPGRINHVYGYSWPAITLRYMSGVKIRFSSGMGEVGTTTSSPDYVVELIPSAVKDAIMLYCAWCNENRTAEAGAVPKQFYNLLDPERIFS